MRWKENFLKFLVSLVTRFTHFVYICGIYGIIDTVDKKPIPLNSLLYKHFIILLLKVFKQKIFLLLTIKSIDNYFMYESPF